MAISDCPPLGQGQGRVCKRLRIKQILSLIFFSSRSVKRLVFTYVQLKAQIAEDLIHLDSPFKEVCFFVTGYLVEMKRVGRRNWIPQNGGRTVVDRTMKIKDLAQDNEYQFRVTAENEGGNGAPGKDSDIIVAKDPIRKWLVDRKAAEQSC